MARHGEILDSFKQKVDNFDFTNEEHVTCVCLHYALQDHIASPPVIQLFTVLYIQALTLKQAGLYLLCML